MEIKKGIPVSQGVAICRALVLHSEEMTIPRRVVGVEDIARQHQRLDEALEASRQQIEELRQQMERELGAEIAAIFGFHLGILMDPSLTKQLHDLITAERVTAEYAVSTVMQQYAQRLLSQSSELFRERVADMTDLERRILRQLLKETRHELENLDSEAIIVAHDLTPSQTASLNQSLIQAFVTDVGGRTSHSAIVARAMGIPAVVGLEDISSSVSANDVIIVDGHRGLVIINPDESQLAEYRKIEQQLQEFQSQLVELADLPAITTDGHEIQLLANIEFFEEIAIAMEKGAKGVGLYRTEYLFLSTETEPDEQTQYQTFAKTVKALAGRPLTIRTFDLGADKYTQKHAENPENNPFLGCRSIRFCLQNLPMFRAHLRAILRASAHGKIRVMFPLISNMLELRQARMILQDVMEDLEDEGIDFDPDVAVGMMIETPSAALMARVFTREVDFFSIGTNDLVQYTLAVDRGNENVANLYNPANPAVLKLIKGVVRMADQGLVDVSICGEMAGETEFVMLLIGMGLQTLSMTPQAIPLVKKLIRAVSLADCQRVARRVVTYETERQVVNYLRDETRKILPEAFDGNAIV
jgi:phosphotransferase system enzyme I (PtsI)